MTTDVLVVDDDPAMGQTVVEILGLHDVTAVAVTSPNAAIARQRELRPAVVICDQRLPDISGLELCTTLRTIDPDVSLILLTGHATLDTAIAAVGLIDQYLTKPVPPQDLVAATATALSRAASRRADRQETEQAAARLAAIIEGTDDAVIAMTLDGVITGWNRGAEHLYGHQPGQVIGQSASILLPPDHPDDLVGLLEMIREGGHADHFETKRMRADQTVLQVSLSVSPIHDTTGQVVGASSIARDITDRLAADELRQQLEDSAKRRTQALQINDSIVQNLVVAQARLDIGDVDGGVAALRTGLAHARGLIDDLLPDRSLDSPEPVPPSVPAVTAAPRQGECAVVIADDSAEIRSLVRMLLELGDGFYVVGEAEDGHQAIEAARSHQPDLILLDHAMPNLDGLSALPGIKEAAPASVVVMLSGFSAERLEESALAGGAAAYVTKADLATRLVPEIERIMGVRRADAAS